MNKQLRKGYVILYWVVITLVILYDRRFLVQKINLGHFVECIVVRVALLLALAYLNINVLMPRLLEKGKILLYVLSLVVSVSTYIILQQAYDVYLYGFVMGDIHSRSLRSASLYLVFTTIWYLFLTIIFHRALDWYDQRRQVEWLELEIKQMKDKEATLSRESVNSDIFLKSGTRKVRIDREAITYVQGLKDYAILFTSENRLIVKGTLKSVEEMFPPGMLIRIHKSYLVVKNKVSSVSAHSVQIGNQVVPIGRSYRQNVKNITLEDL